ncbi:MAG: hypothetical protein ACOC91_00005 [bacterium]
MAVGHRLAIFAGIGALVLTAGCANKVPPEVVESADYQTGYADGCATGNRRTSGFKDDVTRNDTLFHKSENYAIGWRQGYNVCGGSQADSADRDIEFLTTDRFDQGPI